MPQTLSLSNSGVNPYTEVKVTNKYWTSDGRLMCFGEFIDPETGKYASTIINSNSDDCAFILSFLANGTLINTTEPRINTSAKIANKGYTKYRVYMREICEQPIYIQELSKRVHTEGLSYEDLEYVSDEIKKELKPEQKQEATKETEKLPYRIGVAKTTLRYKYIDKLVADSPRSQSSKNVHAETAGDLVDYCIEHNINPYQNDA